MANIYGQFPHWHTRAEILAREASMALPMLLTGAGYALKSLGKGAKRGSRDYVYKQPSMPRRRSSYRKAYGFGSTGRRRRYGVGKTRRRGIGPHSLSLINARRIDNMRTGGLVGLEPKFRDRNLLAATISTVGALTGGEIDPATVLCLNSMDQGTSPSERLGRFITMKTLQIKFHLETPAYEAAVNPLADINIFIALVLDKQTNNAQLSSEDVYQNVGATPELNGNPMRNMQHTDRFKVLKTKKIIMKRSIAQMNEGGINLFAGGSVTKDFEWYIGLNNLRTQFTVIGDTVAQIQDNSLHLIAFATSGNTEISYHSRLRFYTT